MSMGACAYGYAGRLRPPVRCGLLVLGALLTALLGPCRLAGQESGPVPIQPVLLPLASLLATLDPAQEWQLVPLGMFQALRGVPVAPGRCWIESAQLRAVLGEDLRLSIHASLVVVGTGRGACSCPLFAALPATSAAASCDGGPAWFALRSVSRPLPAPAPGPGPAAADADDGSEPAPGLDLVVRGAGRHVVELDYASAPATAAGDVDAPLPLAAVLDLQLQTVQAGRLSSADLAPQAAGIYRLRRRTSQLVLRWEPGAGAGPGGVFGMAQQLQVTLRPGARTFHWTARWDVRQGSAPPQLTITLPAGWTALNPGAGATALRVQGTSVTLQCAAGAPEIGCDGLVDDAARIGLPRIEQARWQDGVIDLLSDQALDCSPPSQWQALPAASAQDRGLHYAVPGPDQGALATLVAVPATLRCDSTAWALLGAQRWRLEQQLRLSPGPGIFALHLQLPAGWSVVALDCPCAAAVPEPGAVADGAQITLDVPRGSAAGEAWLIDLVLERTALAHGAIRLATVAEATSVAARLRIVPVDALRLQVEAASPWHGGAPGDLAPAPALPGGAAAVELVAAAAPTPVTIAVSQPELTVQAQAVLQLLPRSRESWCRLDLQVQVADGELQDLAMRLPWSDAGRVQCSAPWSLAADGAGGWILHAASPWQGVRTLRLEGPLLIDQGRLPLLALGCVAGPRAPRAPLTLATVLVLSQDAVSTLELQPGPALHALDGDELPAWSATMPGTTLVGAYRLDGAELGTVRVATRRAAPGPRGFIDQLHVRTQIQGAHAVTLLTAVVAGAGLDRLGWDLPAGCRLAEVTCDGLSATVAHDGTRATLLLPGRTQVQLALMIAQEIDPGAVDIRLPAFDLPVTSTTWLVGISGATWIGFDHSAGAMPLGYRSPPPELHLLSGWSPGALQVDQPPVPLPAAADQDQRQLAGADAVPAVRGEPGLVVSGTLLEGRRIGVAELRLRIGSLAAHTAAYRLVVALGVLAGVALAGRMRRGRGALLGAGALGIAIVLRDICPEAAAGCGAAATCLLLGDAWYVARRWRGASAQGAPTGAAPALVLLLLGALVVGCGQAPAPGAEDDPGSGVGACLVAPQVQLMGYDHLDGQHRPAGVVVALTAQQWQALQDAGAGGEPAAADGLVLACGPADWQLHERAAHLVGTLTLPVAVLSRSWQQLRWHLAGCVVTLVRADALPGGGPAGAMTWGMQGQDLVISCAGAQRLQLTLALVWNARLDADRWSVRLPACAAGGMVTLAVAPGWAVQADGEPCALGAAGDGGATLRLGLPLSGDGLVLSGSRSATATLPGALTVVHAIDITLTPSHLDWQDQLTLGGAAGPAPLTVVLPPELVVVRVAGAQAWQQHGAALRISWGAAADSVGALGVYGIIPRAAGDGAAALLAHVAHARESGRVALHHGRTSRFEQPAGLLRAPSRPDEDLAAVWNDPPSVAMATISWRDREPALSLRERLALVVGVDRVRVVWQLSLHGSGVLAQLHLRLPPPWTLRACRALGADGVGDPAAGAELVASGQAFLSGAGAQRVLVLRPPQGLGDQGAFTVWCDAPRPEVGSPFVAPDGRPLDGVVLDGQSVVVGDGGEPRVEAVGGGAGEEPAGLTPLAAGGAALLPVAASLRADERWRFAWQRPGDAALQLVTRHEPVITELAVSHFLRVDLQGARWSLRLQATPQQGAVQDLHLLLPPSVRLRSLAVANLGTWRCMGQDLIIHLAVPSRSAVVVVLELEQAWTGSSLQIQAVTSADGQPLGEQRVALAVSDDCPFVHQAPDGLERDDQPAAGLPLGVVTDQLDGRYRATRPLWSLGLTRGAWSEPGGLDGVVNLLDLHSVVAAGGEVRSSARYGLYNRSRREVALVLPAGTEVWQVRIDGMAVTTRLDDQDPTLRWLSVPLGRTGAAATAIEVVWREAHAPGRPMTLVAPQLRGMRVMRTVWRFGAGSDLTLSFVDGSIQPCRAAMIPIARAQTLIEAVGRLRALEGLNPHSLARLGAELSRIDGELDDDQVMLETLPASASGADPAADADALQDIRRARSQAQEELRRLDREAEARALRRAQLGFDGAAPRWPETGTDGQTAGDGPAWSDLTLSAPQEVPWRAPQVAALESLGPGASPPGLGRDGDDVLLGIDLLDSPGAPDQLTLSGSSDAPQCRIRLAQHRASSAEPAPWQKAFWLLTAGVW